MDGVVYNRIKEKGANPISLFYSLQKWDSVDTKHVCFYQRGGFLPNPQADEV